MEYSAAYSLNDDIGQEALSGDCTVILKKEDITIMPKFNEPIYLTFRDIVSINEVDHKINLTLTSKEILTIFKLGYKFDDFLRVLSRYRNEITIKDMLMHESLKISGIDAEYAYFNESGNKLTGKCDIRLYESALLLIPEKDEIVRIPYCDIQHVSEENYSLNIITDFNESLMLSKMGSKIDYLTKTLGESINKLSVKSQSSLKEILPNIDPMTIRRVSRFMREGKAARRSDIESVSPQLWKELEKRIDILGIGDEYKFLESLSQKHKMCIGFKRGLLGDLTSEYTWFLTPIYDTDHNKPGNIMAMEAVSESGGKATYFFKIVSREDYRNYNNIEELHQQADKFITRINRSLMAVNFRRAPIYLPDDKLEEVKYQKYKIAVSKIPQLKELRNLFVGRIIHGNIDRWKNDVMELCRFNVSTTDEFAKWTRDNDMIEDDDIIENNDIVGDSESVDDMES